MGMLNSGKRGEMEIMAAIVVMTQKPANVTRIMGQVNISYLTLLKYLKFMLKLRLIEKHDNEGTSNTLQLYEATEKGISYLKKYCDILKLLYGDAFLKLKNDLAVACLQFCENPYPQSST
jgi:predicted transcriptional regulator